MVNNTAMHDFFATTDSVLICDTDGNILFYENFDEEIMVLKNKLKDSITIFEMYPFIEPDEFTVIKCMKTKTPLINEIQYYNFYGKKKCSINSAYPLMTGDKLLGGIVLTTDITKATYPIKHNFEDIITADTVFLKRLEALKLFARSNSSILIYGETGTGKELIAHTIHANSKRYGKPFIVQNCAAIPDTLMESIFFGTAKGSFTGSIDKEGLFEAANGGTLFLDEINSLPLGLQGKILRAIENRTITRIGESKERNIDVRIIASTNEDLAHKVSLNQFRADLFYRLNVIRFDIPPLRNRICDIGLLFNHYIQYYNGLLGKDVSGIEPEALKLAEKYGWPGNVRELRNVIEAILNIKKEGLITVTDLPKAILDNTITASDIIEQELSINHLPFGVLENSFSWDSGKPLSTQMERFEKYLLEEALKTNRNHICKTASSLGISRQTLYNKMNKYGLL